MQQLVRSWVGILSGLALLLAPALSQAQCLVASCTPGTASASNPLTSTYRMGIYNVTLGSLNNTTAGYTDGYQDYSCTLGTSLTVSTAAAISITNGTVANENVRVWIDYNNDGTFASTEQVFASDNKKLHTGTIVPPASAVLNTRLRLRVASDYADGTVPTACSTPQYSQDEDYAVTLLANTSPPAAAFSVSVTTTCSGSVQFADQSSNGPTAWRWDFGDGTTSTQQNPAHTYATVGTYQVRLTATNAVGAGTSAATAITYNATLPVAASCPGLAATANCCNYGIVRVRLGSIDNASADGSAGYQDFTCPQRTTLTAGLPYSLGITTGGASLHDTRAWLDLNNNGTFEASEKIGESLNAASPRLTFTVPTTATLGQPLRLRLTADGVGTNPQPCGAPTLGQTEDYTVTLVPNTSVPGAAFTSTYAAGACTTPANTYTFTDQSTGGPTAWQWSFSPSAGVSFVNGTSATSQNPQVAFAAVGSYSVTLTATNANGSNTLTASNYLLVQLPCLTYCNANGGYSGGATSSLWITNVSVSAAPGGAAFSSSSGNATGGYALVNSPTIGVQVGASQTITVTTNQSYSHRTSIWIDYNHDGIFANATELVTNTTVNGSALSTATFTSPVGLVATRMRVAVTANANSPNACALNQGEAEVEDYLLNVLPLATQPAQALAALTVSPNPTPDGQLHVQVSDPSASGTYELAVENLLGARLLSRQLRLSTTAPASLDLSTLPAGLYLVRLTDAQGTVALRRVVRQ
jgi:PKD repeat protein